MGSNDHPIVVNSFLILPNIMVHFQRRAVIKDLKMTGSGNKNELMKVALMYMLVNLLFIHLLQQNLSFLLISISLLPSLFSRNYVLMIMALPCIFLISNISVPVITIAAVHLIAISTFLVLFLKNLKYDPSIYLHMSTNVIVLQSVLVILYFTLFDFIIHDLPSLVILSFLNLFCQYATTQLVAKNVIQYTVYYISILCGLFAFINQTTTTFLIISPILLCAIYAHFQVPRVTILQPAIDSNIKFIAFIGLLLIWPNFQNSTFPVPAIQTRGQLRQQCLSNVHNYYLDTFKTILSNHSSAAYLGTVNHLNLGDSFIWYAEELMLSKLGINIVYACHTDKCNPRELNKRIGSGILMFRGGGNWGDLYRFETTFRNKFIKAYPNNQIVVMPQSIKYKKSYLIENDANLYKKHPNLHLMVRSVKSHNVLKSHFKNNQYLMPDSALSIGHLEPLCQPKYDVVFLKRTDTEGVLKNATKMTELFTENGITWKQLDWFDAEREEFKTNPKFTRQSTYESRQPIFRLQMANRILCQGKVILTDRLHATVLALLMDKPVVCLENSYGKIHGVTNLLEYFGGTSCSADNLRRYYTPGHNMTLAMLKVKEYLKETK